MTRWKYFTLGLAASLGCLGLLSIWDELPGILLGRPPLAYDPQPGWLKVMPRIVGYLPWLVGIGLFAFELKRRQAARVWPYALGAFLPLAAVSLWILTESTVSNWWHRERFDSARWRASSDTTEVFWPTRLRMVDDLLARKVLYGVTRDSTLALLGPPNPGWSDTASTFRYYLGPERGFIRIDSEELVISFDAADKVAEAKTVTD